MFQPVLAAAASLPRLHGRRTRLWLILVTTIVVMLAAKALFPALPILPEGLSHLSAAAMLAVFLAALACEYMDSSLGMGYGTTLTPLLLVAGFEPLQIVPAVLVSELITGLAAGWMHHRDGNVDFLRDARARRTVLHLTALSAGGAIAAVFVAVSISKFLLGVFITAIVLAMGVIILLTRNRQIRYRSGSILAVGAIAAFNKGLSGGGYGPLVTAGQVVSGLPAKHGRRIVHLRDRRRRLPAGRPGDRPEPGGAAGARCGAVRADGHRDDPAHAGTVGARAGGRDHRVARRRGAVEAGCLTELVHAMRAGRIAT